jgi:hypothetical protein
MLRRRILGRNKVATEHMEAFGRFGLGVGYGLQ